MTALDVAAGKRLSLGEQVRNARGTIGLRELARRLEITASYLSDIEHDRRRPSVVVWKALSLAVPVWGGALAYEKAVDLRRHDPEVYEAIRVIVLSEAKP